jgi:hypothetical protein
MLFLLTSWFLWYIMCLFLSCPSLAWHTYSLAPCNCVVCETPPPLSFVEINATTNGNVIPVLCWFLSYRLSLRNACLGKTTNFVSNAMITSHIVRRRKQGTSYTCVLQLYACRPTSITTTHGLCSHHSVAIVVEINQGFVIRYKLPFCGIIFLCITNN